MKKVIITGGTGLLGTYLSKLLQAKGHQVYLFTRNIESAKRKSPEASGYFLWKGNAADYSRELTGMDAVIHLAGANVAGRRWNEAYKKEILESRTGSTRALIESMKKLDKRPETFICSSAVGYYGNRGDEELTENSQVADTFLADVCRQWEEEAAKAGELGVRTVSIRTGVVLSVKDGALNKMLLPFKLFAGGPLGNGRQWFPWIHIDDIAGIYMHAIENTGMRGIYNGAAPKPVRMKEFAKTLGEVLHRPSLFPVPEFVIKIVLGEGAGVAMASQRVNADKIVSAGYKFSFPEIKGALVDVIEKGI